MAKMPDNYIDFIFTDPPYGRNNIAERRIKPFLMQKTLY
jgi:DNA modification methylase